MKQDPWKNKLYFGDNLEIMREFIGDETIDLIYLDPPFNSKATYNVLYQKKNGSASATQICSEGRVLGDGGGAGGIGAPLQKTDMNQIVLKAREVLALSPACSILYTVQKRAPENLPSNISGARERLARVVSARS